MGTSDRQDAGVSTILTMLAIGVTLFLVTGLVVAGAAAIWIVKTQSEQSRVMAQQQFREAESIRNQIDAERDRAMAAMAQAESSLENAEQMIMESAQQFDQPRRTVTVRIDVDGNMTVDGHSVEAAEVKQSLQRAHRTAATQVEVHIYADRRCVYEHIQAVTSACESLGIRKLRFRLLE
jgi:biopolymer transport protein ExbD